MRKQHKSLNDLRRAVLGLEGRAGGCFPVEDRELPLHASRAERAMAHLTSPLPPGFFPAPSGHLPGQAVGGGSGPERAGRVGLGGQRWRRNTGHVFDPEM